MFWQRRQLVQSAIRVVRGVALRHDQQQSVGIRHAEDKRFPPGASARPSSGDPAHTLAAAHAPRQELPCASHEGLQGSAMLAAVRQTNGVRPGPASQGPDGLTSLPHPLHESQQLASESATAVQAAGLPPAPVALRMPAAAAATIMPHEAPPHAPQQRAPLRQAPASAAAEADPRAGQPGAAGAETHAQPRQVWHQSQHLSENQSSTSGTAAPRSNGQPSMQRWVTFRRGLRPYPQQALPATPSPHHTAASPMPAAAVTQPSPTERGDLLPAGQPVSRVLQQNRAARDAGRARPQQARSSARSPAPQAAPAPCAVVQAAAGAPQSPPAQGSPGAGARPAGGASPARAPWQAPSRSTTAASPAATAPPGQPGPDYTAFTSPASPDHASAPPSRRPASSLLPRGPSLARVQLGSGGPVPAASPPPDEGAVNPSGPALQPAPHQQLQGPVTGAYRRSIQPGPGGLQVVLPTLVLPPHDGNGVYAPQVGAAGTSADVAAFAEDGQQLMGQLSQAGDADVGWGDADFDNSNEQPALHLPESSGSKDSRSSYWDTFNEAAAGALLSLHPPTRVLRAPGASTRKRFASSPRQRTCMNTWLSCRVLSPRGERQMVHRKASVL